MFIEQPSTFLRWLYPKAVWRMNSHEKAVYLTFDDGPLPETTPFILDTRHLLYGGRERVATP